MIQQKLIEEWLRLDKNESTRAEIASLSAANNEAELEQRLGSRIEFGTAGLRGRMEAGFSRMNDLTIIQASQGLCAYVVQMIPDAKTRGIVIGHDHRHHSDRWALLTAAAFIGEGVKAYLHRGLVHTPLVPFSVGRLNAACGVMITASHNPKTDNGYKVYWENGVQIIGPHDEGIAHAILDNLEPSPTAWNVENILTSPLCINATDKMVEAYFEQLSKLSHTRSINSQTDIKFVSTAMHGVGYRFAARAFEVFGFKPFFPVESQKDPNPEFPTVPFPNPEEKGALNLALAEADKQGAQYVLAQDPDADRFAAAERQSDNGWKVFSGDQLGSLLAAWTLECRRKENRLTEKTAMVASTVSSKMVRAMARSEGFHFVESLTGFKYIGNAALDLVKQGYEVPFGYEEAIGFMLGEEVRDKDGVAATICFAELAVSLRGEGKTVAGYLDELYARYGYYQTSNSYFICKDPSVIDRIFARLRSWLNNPFSPSSCPARYPSSLGGLEIMVVRDLTIGHGYDSAAPGPDHMPALPLSGGQMITFTANSAAAGLTLTIRTSGTEPKIKYYLEGSGANRAEVGSLLEKAVDELRVQWMQAKENLLGEP
ncbi:Phosphoglucomutase-3 [Tulasnella sp. JGI-2019a]|nr:Phosphoglucomutase-3 [Tulasnella sp. JGI-2019a]